MVEDFASDWENQEASDCGNRNLCECEKKRADGACRQHDIYRVYTTGRSGATLYWEKYWNGSNLSLPFRWTGDELEDMDAAELATVRREMLAFNEAIKNLMAAFYETCKDRLEDARAEKAAEEKAEKEYQAIKTQVLKKGCIKRLISEIL